MDDYEYDDYDRYEDRRSDAMYDAICDDEDYDYDEYEENGFIDSADYYRYRGF